MLQEEELDEHNNQITPPGFHLIFLPFTDDLRKLKYEETPKGIRVCQNWNKVKKTYWEDIFFMVKVTTYRHQGDFYLRFEPHSIVLRASRFLFHVTFSPLIFTFVSILCINIINKMVKVKNSSQIFLGNKYCDEKVLFY